MCEYSPTCTKSDDPLAAGLWTRREHAYLLVLCPPRRHPLAALFDFPERGRVVVAPGFPMLRRSLLVDVREDHDLEDPNGLHCVHGMVIPLAEYAPGETERGRCRCGTWTFPPQDAERRLFGKNHRGQRYTLGNYVDTADSEAAKLDRGGK